MTVLTQDEIKRIRKIPESDFDRAFDLEIRKENKQGVVVLHFMLEADRRRQWAKRGFDSLKKYCITQFKMSETDFYRKFSAMKVIREMPEIEEKIVDGSISTVNLAKLNTFMRYEKKSKMKTFSMDEKRTLVSSIENKTQNQVERDLATLSPEMPQADRSRAISEYLTLNTFTSDRKLDRMLARCRELLSNALPQDANQNDLLKKMCAIVIEKLEPKKPKAAMEKPKITTVVKRCGNKSVASIKPWKQKPVHGYLAVEVRRAVIDRDLNCCTFVDALTSRRCETRSFLQFDHIVPKALGGEDTIENLRLRCAAHNRLHAIDGYGARKMGEHLKLN